MSRRTRRLTLTAAAACLVATGFAPAAQALSTPTAASAVTVSAPPEAAQGTCALPRPSAGNATVVNARLTGANKAARWQYDVTYPQVRGVAATVAGRINTTLTNGARWQAGAFTQLAASNGPTPSWSGPNRLTSGCDTRYADRTHLSIIQTFYTDFAGAAHGNEYAVAHTFDLRTGAETAPAALFAPRSDYAGVLARAAFGKIDPFCRPGTAGELATQIRPVAGQLNTMFGLTRTGLRIVFQKYAIAPGACGLVVVDLPYAQARAALAPGALPVL